MGFHGYCWLELCPGPQGAEPQAVIPAMSLRMGSGWTSREIPRGSCSGSWLVTPSLVTPCGSESHTEQAVWGTLWSSGPEDSCITGGGGLKRRLGFP